MTHIVILYIIVFQVLGLASCKEQTSEMKSATHEMEVLVTDTISKPAEPSWAMDYIMGKFDPTTHPDFTVIPAKYRDGEIRYLRKDVLEAFIIMYEAALQDGVTLKILSATRNFDYQKRIWENKWTGKTILEDNVNAARDIADPELRARKILKYSSMPGTSRHHWGTDIDLNNFNNSYFASGEGLKLYNWMKGHAQAYGFCQPYSEMGTDRTSGYNEEKWHWSYMPLASVLTEQASLYFNNEMVTGFMGSETAISIDMLHNYILGISQECNLK